MNSQLSHLIRPNAAYRTVILRNFFGLRLIVSLSLFLLCLQQPKLWVHAANHSVLLEGETITLHAEQTPLAVLLADLSRQGVIVKIDPAINPDISAHFDQIPVDQVLPAILKPYNYSLVWRKQSTASGTKLLLSEIQVFQRGQENRIAQVEQDLQLEIVRGEDGSLYVRNSLLLQLSPSLTQARLLSILDTVGARIDEVFENTGIVKIVLPDGVDPADIADTLTEFEEISRVEPDYAYALDQVAKVAEDFSTDETERSLQPSEGAPVAVLDSGLSTDYASQPFVNGVYDALANSENISDPVGHGTQMSLVASGMVIPLGTGTSPTENTDVVAVRAFDNNGFTSNATLVRSIDYALAADAEVVSMSWGSEQSSEMLELVVDYATSRGLILVAAAGNSPTGVPVYPAAYEEVIGVGALMPNGTRWEQSNFGDFVSIYAPGVAKMPVGHNGGAGIYAGTSIATAYIANRIAQIKSEDPDIDIDGILLRLQQEQ